MNRMIRGDNLIFSEDELNSTFPNESALGESNYFRKQCIQAGFKLTHLYPIYYHGWEMDEWGAIGTRDGETFRLETNHGHLVPEKM